MRRQLVDQVAPPIYAAVDFAAIVAPALYLKVAADRAGLGEAQGVDLLVASAVIGAAHAVLAWSRLRSEERVVQRRADLWIAAIDALVVLALGATLLLIAVLHGFAGEHAALADRGYPVVALWVGIQLLAVIAAEATGWFVFWWLEPPARSEDGVSYFTSRPPPPRWGPRRRTPYPVLNSTELNNPLARTMSLRRWPNRGVSVDWVTPAGPTASHGMQEQRGACRGPRSPTMRHDRRPVDRPFR